MAQQEIKLKKLVKSPKNAIAFEHSPGTPGDRSFQEVAKSPESIDEQFIINFYEEVFYNIPKNGKLSHEEIIERSHHLLNPNEDEMIQSKIESRQHKLGMLNDQLFKLSSPSIKEHPIYPDGTIIKVASENTSGTNIQNPYIMQEGVKRYFSNDRLYNIVRRALGQPEQDFESDVVHIPLQEAILIPDGEEIKTAADLNKKNIEIIDRIEDIPFENLRIGCVGIENTEAINNVINIDYDNWNYDINLDEDCILLVAETYYDDDGITLLSRAKEIKIPAVGANTEANYVHLGTSLNIAASTVPEMIEPAYGDYYSNWINKEPYNNTPFEDNEKKWGKFPDGSYRKFPAIIKAIGRMYYKEETPNNTPTWKILNGTADKYLPDVPKHDGTTQSTWGNPMIYKDCKNRFGQPRSFCFGDLKHQNLLQETVFDNPNSNYYRDKAKKCIEFANINLACIEGRIYGQPIFQEGYKKYKVLLGTRSLKYEAAGRVIFQGTVSVFYRVDKSTEKFEIEWGAETGGSPQLMGADILGDKLFDYKNVGSQYISYLGLQGEPLNHGGNFKYNPDGENGTNDGLTSYMRQWLP